MSTPVLLCRPDGALEFLFDNTQGSARTSLHPGLRYAATTWLIQKKSEVPSAICAHTNIYNDRTAEPNEFSQAEPMEKRGFRYESPESF